jgi:alpha-glucosidase
LDYFYTAFHQASVDGTPVLNPLWFLYPSDSNTWSIDLQFFFGNAILVSPVTEDNSTSVDIYLPKDTFYDFISLAPVEGQGRNLSLTNVNFTTIPVHIRSGVVLPLRLESAMTTTQLRTKDFELIIAPNSNGTASGSLYIDDGVSLVQTAVTQAEFKFANSTLAVSGHFGFKTTNRFACARFLNISKSRGVVLNGNSVTGQDISYDGGNKVLTVNLDLPLSGGFQVQLLD